RARWTRRFRRRASSDSLLSLTESRKASMPPLISIVFRPRVVTRRRTDWPRASLSTLVSCRLGRKRRRVLLLALLTVLPGTTPLPEIKQRRDMVNTSSNSWTGCLPEKDGLFRGWRPRGQAKRVSRTACRYRLG